MPALGSSSGELEAMSGGGHVASDSTIRTVEVFRPGTFTPMAGTPISFTEQDLIALASGYDAAAHPAPAVVGHPKTDDPAFAWARAFRWDEGKKRLLADLAEIEPAFGEAVAAGRYKRVSLALFTPDAPHNPKPGQYYPKHIGFLGAAAPAVSGLKPVQFSADEQGVAVFEFADASALRDVAGLFRSVRDFLIEKFGLDTADKTLPVWTINWVDEAADRDPPEAGRLAGFAGPASSTEIDMTKDNQPSKAGADTAALDARAAELDRRERELAHTDNVAFAERIVAEGRLLPALRDKTVALLDALSPVGGTRLEVSFAEGGETRTDAGAELLKALLAAQPAISFGALDTGEAPGVVAEFAVPPGMGVEPGSAEIHNKALAHQAAHPGTDYMAAVAAVTR
jgi:hypothetical protein